MSRTFDPSEGAVSEILGEMLLMAVTVLVFMMLVLGVGAFMSARQPTSILTIQASAAGPTSVQLQHQGGDSLPQAAIGISVNGAAAAFALADTNGNGQWDVGESIIINGLDTSQRLDIVVFNKATNQALGEFTIGG